MGFKGASRGFWCRECDILTGILWEKTGNDWAIPWDVVGFTNSKSESYPVKWFIFSRDAGTSTVSHFWTNVLRSENKTKTKIGLKTHELTGSWSLRNRRYPADFFFSVYIIQYMCDYVFSVVSSGTDPMNVCCSCCHLSNFASHPHVYWRNLAAFDKCLPLE